MRLYMRSAHGLQRSYFYPGRLGDDIISLLLQYLKISQKYLGFSIRKIHLSKYMFSLERFIVTYNEFMQNKPKRISEWKIVRLRNLYESVIKIMNALKDNRASEDNFNSRCMLLGAISPFKAEQLKEYLIDSPGSFILFNCLFNFIFNSMPLGKNYKEILYSRFDFHADFNFMTLKELETKLNMKIRGIRIKEDIIRGRINSIIDDLRVLKLWFHYQNLINMKAKVIRISPQLCEKIKMLEGLDKITPGFIATVFSIIYEYEIKRVTVNGKFCYYLVKPEYADNYFPLLEKLAPLIEARIDMPEFEDLGEVVKEMFFCKRDRVEERVYRKVSAN